jgi:hypothetical protein
MESKSQSQLDYLRQLHVLDRIEDDQSWECVKVLKYSDDNGVESSVQHKYLVEWNDLNNSESWVNFFALCPSNPTPIILFTRDQK